MRLKRHHKNDSFWSDEDVPFSRKTKRTSLLRRVLNNWWERLFGAVAEGNIVDQEAQYEAGRMGADYIWNSAGLAAWGLMFPLYTIVVTQLLGTEQAGMFSLAFVTAQLLLYLANYGMRPYQSSDIEEHHSFLDYQISRWLTCLLMLFVGLLYCHIRGFSSDMFNICIGVFVYRMFDALSDVYEGRLQQKDKLYLAGISQMVRSLVPFVISLVFLVITRSLEATSISLALAGAVMFFVITLPLTLFETPKSTRADLHSIGMLFKQCFPLFIALFLYTFIDNMPKFAIDGFLSYTDQLYFNALYFPAQAILLISGFLCKPLIVRMADAWADIDKRKSFDRLVMGVTAAIAVITLIVAIIMLTIGVPIMSLLYGTDFDPMRHMMLIMLITGGITGGIDFLYQVCAVIRHQATIMRLYLAAFIVALIVATLLVSVMGLEGACIAYLIEMLFLYVLLLITYIRVRVGLAPDESDPRPISARDFE